jgi:DNA modification methylase
MPKHPIHPLCELLPRMTSEEYGGLLESLRSVGQRDEVILLDGQVLDGRHRQDGCEELGIECRYKEFPKAWGDPVEYVMAKAIHRNLNASQKAAVAAHFADHLVDGGVARAKANLRRGTSATSEKSAAAVPADVAKALLDEADPVGRSCDRAAALFGVSPRYVTDARWLRMQDSRAFGLVFAGSVKLSVAKAEARRNAKRKALATRRLTDGPAPHAGRWHLAVSDCAATKGLPSLARRSARLIFADPPYNIGIDYGDGRKADRMPEAQYLAFVAAWVEQCAEVLTADGSLWVLINDEWADHYGVILRKAGLHRRAWVKWYETFGVNCADNFNRTSRHLFYCVKDPADFVFDRAAFNRPSDRQAKYGDKRAAPGGKVWDDVWGINPPIPRLVENAAERLPDFPTQLPLALVRPIVAGCSEPGDLVVDPFNGSGTTGEAAVTQGRNYVGFDVSKKFVEAARRRLNPLGFEALAADEITRRP